MYPQMNKEQIPSAPPSYSESVSAPKYVIDPQHAGPNCQYPPPPMAQGQPNQMVVVQVVSGSKFLFNIFRPEHTIRHHSNTGM